MAKYRCDQIDPRIDGTGDVRFDVWALDDDGVIIPGKHKDVLVPNAELMAALQLIGAARTAAVKNLLVTYAGPDWDNAGLDAIALANLMAEQAAAAMLEWIEPPVEFEL